jgi:probable HAF family extracellular repeat protein
MRSERAVNSWTKAWGLALLSIEIFHIFPAQAQQDKLTDSAEQGDDPRGHNPKHHHYKLIDLGTFGGPASYVNFFFNTLNNQGTVVGNSETTIPQPPTTNGFPCPPGQVYKAFVWRDGVVHDLGALPGGNCSDTTAINALGQIVGTSETDEVDPLTGVNEIRAVIWKNGQIQDLGTFGGNQSSGWTINNHGQVAGFALNDTPDPYSMFDLPILGSSVGTQTRAFIWQNGKMEDLGTLGGPDALGFYINEMGQVAGVSYTNANPESLTGVPEVHPFLWHSGEMKDLGSFGGAGIPFLTTSINGMNNRGQVIGALPLPGDQILDPFVWDGTKLIDMATQGTGGSFFDANVINDAGMVAGGAAFPNRPNDAALWKDGVATDLGFLAGDCYSEAWSINNRGQVGGVSVSCDGNVWRAFLWEDGSMIDLNSVIPAGSNLQLVYAVGINDRGEIAGNGVLPGASTAPPDQDTMSRAFVLIPCDEGHPDVEGCDYDMVDEKAVTRQSPAPVMQKQTTTAPSTPALNGPSNDVRTMLRGRLGFNRFMGNARQVALRGAVAATSGPIAALSPTSLAFWPSAIGTTNGASSVTLKNTGATSLTISRIAITGPNAGDFAQTHTCGSSLAAGASCEVDVSFKPTQIGNRTGMLSVSDNAHGSPQTVSLSGTGTDVELSPTHLNFGCFQIIVLGCVCVRSETATLTNVGRTTLKISGVAISAGAFSQTNSCGASVPAGGSCSINVRWTPSTGTGLFDSGLVSISDNGGASPQTLGLVGNKGCHRH